MPIRGLSSTTVPRRGASANPTYAKPPVAGLRSSQVNQALYGIRYNPAVQNKLNRSPEKFQSLRGRNSLSYNNQSQSTRNWGKGMHETLMDNIQRRKDLQTATKLRNQLNEATVQVGQGAQPQAGTTSDLQKSVGITKSQGGLSPFRSEIIQRARSYLGTPYTLGGGHQPNATKPSRGYNGIYGLDCSGLTGIVYRQMGINLPGIANQQSVYGKRTSIANARPGDLVGWARGGHIAIYIGGGKILHAPRPGEVVQIRNLFRGEKVFAVQLTLPGD